MSLLLIGLAALADRLRPDRRHAQGSRHSPDAVTGGSGQEIRTARTPCDLRREGVPDPGSDGRSPTKTDNHGMLRTRSATV